MIGVVLAGLGLSSCTEDDGPPSAPGPLPSSTPVFASEEEALAAAEAAYARYVEVSNNVGANGWVDVEPLSTVLRSTALEDALETVADYRVRRLKQVGDVRFDSMTLQSFRGATAGKVEVSVYLCIDVADVDLVDAEGDSVIAPDRPDRQPVEVVIDDIEGDLKISRSESWSGSSFC